MQIFLFSFIILLLFFIQSIQSSCLHDFIFAPSKKIIEPQNYEVTTTTKAISSGLSFEVVYETNHCTYVGQNINLILGCESIQSYNCTSDDILTQDKENFLKNEVIPQSLSFWSQILSVDGFGVNITGNQCCGVQITPRESYSNYVIFISFHPTSGDVIGWAGACRQDQNGRPIAGHANFGPNKVNITNFQKAYLTAVHEFAHALGFSATLYNDYKYLNSSNGLTSFAQVTKAYYERSHTVTKLVTPKITKFVQENFACSDMKNPGAELEDGGTSGTTLSHFEKRIFNNELMTGSITSDTVVTPATLAIFEDMGWYTVTKSSSSIQPLTWGKDEGCDFLEKKCSEWSSNYFCQSGKCGSSYQGCTYDKKSKAYCAVVSYSTYLPSYSRYFTDPTKGGDDPLADFCPIYRAYSNGDCTDVTSQGSDIIGEVFSANSLCFESTASRTGQRTVVTDDCGDQQHVICHRYKCINDSTTSATLRVYFGANVSHYIDCPRSGGAVDIYTNLSSRLSVCKDNSAWSTGYQYPANCSDFVGRSCFSLPDIGQFTQCPFTCQSCAAYSGNITCPPASKFCDVEVTPRMHHSGISDDVFAGIIVAGLSFGAIIFALIYRKFSRRKGKVYDEDQSEEEVISRTPH